MIVVHRVNAAIRAFRNSNRGGSQRDDHSNQRSIKPAMFLVRSHRELYHRNMVVSTRRFQTGRNSCPVVWRSAETVEAPQERPELSGRPELAHRFQLLERRCEGVGKTPERFRPERIVLGTEVVLVHHRQRMPPLGLTCLTSKETEFFMWPKLAGLRFLLVNGG